MSSPTAPVQDHVYVSLLKSINTLDVDWKKFASETGIKTTGNAQRKLKENLKKDGLNLVGGNIVALGSEDDVKKTPKATKTDTKEPKSETKKTTSAGKRKTKKDGSDDDYEATPSKKKTKVEVTLESDGEDGEEGEA